MACFGHTSRHFAMRQPRASCSSCRPGGRSNVALEVLHAAQPDDGARSHGSQGERGARHAGARIALGLDAVLVHHATSTSVSGRTPHGVACGLA